MNDTTTAAASRAVDFDTLPLAEQARYLLRADPAKAVALDLTRSDGTAVARMFYDASGGGELDEVTARALRQWAAMIVEHHPAIGAGR